MKARELIRGRAAVAVALVGGFLLGGAAYSAVVAAGASGTSTTYYACLTTSKTLTKVGTAAPKNCPNGGQVISWNSLGPQGDTGNTGSPGLQGPGAQSTSVFMSNGNGSLSLSLADSGDYVVTWDIPDAMPNSGNCSISGLSNAMGDVAGLYSAFITVGSGGGSVTVHCVASPDTNALLTATPTTIQ